MTIVSKLIIAEANRTIINLSPVQSQAQDVSWAHQHIKKTKTESTSSNRKDLSSDLHDLVSPEISVKGGLSKNRSC